MLTVPISEGTFASSVFNMHLVQRCLGAASHTNVALLASVQDEYDPMRPNDYEVVSKLREKRKQQAEVEAQKQAQMREMEAEFQRRKQVGELATKMPILQGSSNCWEMELFVHIFLICVRLDRRQFKALKNKSVNAGQMLRCRYPAIL